MARAEEIQSRVRDPSGDLIEVSVERSGSVHWQYEGNGSGWELIVAPALALANVLSHHVLWRRGWLIRLTLEDRRIWRRRFRSRDAALAQLPAILATASASGVAGLRAHQEARDG